MDPNPKSFPILSYVLDRLPSIGPKRNNDMEEIDLESPPPRPPGTSDPSSSSSATVEIVEQMPYLARPKVISSMTRAIADVSQTRSILRTLGPRPDHESVDAAKANIAGIEAKLSKKLEEIVLSQPPQDVDRLQFRAHLEEKEKECRKEDLKEKAPYRAIVQLDEMHDAYEKLLADAEKRLVKIYESAEASEEASEQWEDVPVNDEVNDKVVEVLHEASGQGMEQVDLSGRKLRFLPEAFGKINGLVVLNVSNNQLEIMPDSIAGLGNLVELNCSSNALETLPDSIGLLENLKILNVSGNKLTALPDPICQCRSLVELDASYNKIAYLPTNIGYGLVNLEKLVVQLNKIRSLPSSIGEMKSLRYLDAHFNELRVLPVAIGKLTNLETLNLGSNFSDLEELPDSIGDLMNLRELDLSNNQIHALPDTFGRLDKLVKLNLEHNPLEMPPPEIVKFGVEAIKVYMAKRWLDIRIEKELKSTTLDVDEDPQNGWVTRSTSWFGTVASGVSGYLGSGSPRDRYLDQQL